MKKPTREKGFTLATRRCSAQHLPQNTSLIYFMHKGGDGKAFVQQLKRSGHAGSSGGCQNKDSWFIHEMELLFDT
jgi:hypothetical protein